MSSLWQVQEAKNRFSEVIERALREGPQTVTRHGRPVVRVVAVEGDAVQPLSGDDGFLEFLMGAPRIEGGLADMPRDASGGRSPLFGDD